MAGLGELGLNPKITGSLIGIIIVVAVVILRSARPRRLRLERLWIRPTLAGLVIIALIARAPPAVNFANAALFFAAIVAGVALGWQRGKLTRLTVDPASGHLTASVSPVGVVIVLLIVVARTFLRTMVASGSLTLPPGLASAESLTDALVFLATATMIAQQIEIMIRARRLTSNPT